VHASANAGFPIAAGMHLDVPFAVSHKGQILVSSIYPCMSQEDVV
jgi:hypothetical protein